MKLILTSILALSFFFLHIAEVAACIYPEITPVAKHLKRQSFKKVQSGVELVDAIYVINLDRRQEKWERMKNILNERGMKAYRFSAVDGWNISEKVQKRLAGNYPVRMLPGEIGCLLSHISVIKDALRRGFNTVWIFEDDIEFIEDPHQMSEYLSELKKIDPKWDILYTDLDSKNNLGVTVPALDADFRPDRKSKLSVEDYSQRTNISDNLMKLGQRYGMYSFLISKKGMKKVYNFFTHVYLWTAIDIDIHYIPKIREYSTTRDIVSIWCNSPFSDTKLELE